MNTKPNSREFVCIDKRIGYLTLLIVPAVILIVISGMINSQKMTQNSRASEYFKTRTTPTPKQAIKTYYINPIMNVCFDSLSEVGKMPMYNGISGIYDEAWRTCYEDLTTFIISNDGKWPGPEVSLTTNISQGFSGADKVAKTWVNSGYLRSSYNYTSGTLQQAARDIIIKNLEKQNNLLSEPLRFSR